MGRVEDGTGGPLSQGQTALLHCSLQSVQSKGLALSATAEGCPGPALGPSHTSRCRVPPPQVTKSQPAEGSKEPGRLQQRLPSLTPWRTPCLAPSQEGCSCHCMLGLGGSRCGDKVPCSLLLVPGTWQTRESLVNCRGQKPGCGTAVRAMLLLPTLSEAVVVTPSPGHAL